MVKVGFICEGDCDKMMLDSENFQTILSELNITPVSKIINGKGVKNLIPPKLDGFVEELRSLGVGQVIILRDLEDHPCYTSAKSETDPNGNYQVIIAKRQIEAWFIADTEALSSFMKSNVSYNNPEELNAPDVWVKEKRIELLGRGINKKKFVKAMLNHHAFDLRKSATHPNCPSAKYFLDKLAALGATNSPAYK